MGTEKDLTAILVRQISDRGGISPAGLRMTGGTPNHKALARCVGYGWGLADENRKLTQMREAKVLQESLAGTRQATTQRLLEMVADGRELARKIRFFVRVPLGSRSELLPAFGITPTRSRFCKTRPVEVLPPSATVPD